MLSRVVFCSDNLINSSESEAEFMTGNVSNEMLSQKFVCAINIEKSIRFKIKQEIGLKDQRISTMPNMSNTSKHVRLDPRQFFPK